MMERPWRIEDEVIMHGNRLVGSIVDRVASTGKYTIEILWSGKGGDITGEFKSYAEAVAFVRGVESTLIAFGEI